MYCKLNWMIKELLVSKTLKYLGKKLAGKTNKMEEGKGKNTEKRYRCHGGIEKREALIYYCKLDGTIYSYKR
jgi:hypothetical protein